MAKPVLHIEVPVQIVDDCWGTADAIVWVPDTRTLHVIDLKYGAGVPVSVRGNLQLKLYALGALLTMGYPAKTIVATIVQPRLPHEDGLIRSVDYASVDLLDFHADVVDAAKRVAEAFRNMDGNLRDKAWVDPYLHPSEKACRWCLAAPKCPKLIAKAQELCKAVFTPALAYDPADLARALDQAPLVEAYIKNLNAFAYAEAEAGRVPLGYKLVEKRATRKWRPDLNTWKLAEALGLTIEKVAKPMEPLAVGELTKQAPGKNAAEREAFLEPFTVKESSGHTLVHESDKREPVRLDARAAFSTLESK